MEEDGGRNVNSQRTNLTETGIAIGSKVVSCVAASKMRATDKSYDWKERLIRTT